jgi:hypothetical protein
MNCAINEKTDEEIKECSICLTNIETSDKITTPCNHIFHNECLTKWLKIAHICPICRYIYKCNRTRPPLIARTRPRLITQEELTTILDITGSMAERYTGNIPYHINTI